jgi:hypothetical protein
MIAVGDAFEDLISFAEKNQLQKACKRCKRVQDEKFFHMQGYCGCKICDSCLIENIKKRNGMCDCQRYIPQEISTLLIYSTEHCAGCGEIKQLVDNFTPLKCDNHILCKVCLEKAISTEKRCPYCYRAFTDEELRTVKTFMELPCELYCRGTIAVEQLIRLSCGHSFCKPCANQAFFYYNKIDTCYVCSRPLAPADTDQVSKLVYELQVRATIKQPAAATITCKVCFGPIGLFQEMKLGCGHSFHKDCLKGHAETFISTVFNHPIRCPDHECQQEIDPNLLQQQLLGDELFTKYSERLTLLLIPGVITCPNMQCREQFQIEGEYISIPCPRCYVQICKSCKQQMGENHDQKRCEFLQTQDKIELLKQFGEGGEIAQCPGCRIPYQKKGCDKVKCLTSGCVEWCFKCSALQVPIELHGKAWHRPNCPLYQPGDPDQVQEHKNCGECQRLQRRCDQPKAMKVLQRFDIDEY